MKIVAVAVLLVALGWFIRRSFSIAITVTEPGLGGRRVEGEGWFGNYYPSRSDGSAPGILVIGGSEGGLHDQVDRDARALQRQGFSVLALAFFRGPDQPLQLALVPLELFETALDWLGSQQEVDADRLAVVGMSKGAEAALLLAAYREDLKAVVAAAPSSVVWPGFDWSRFRGLEVSSWTRKGTPLPALPYGRMQLGKGVRSVFEAGLDGLSAHPDAVIPIEASQADILLICGEKDQVWPSCRMAEQLAARVKNQPSPTVEVRSYPDADHGVFASPMEANSKPRRFGFGTPAAGNGSAQADSWQRAVAFLRTRLDPA